MTTGSEVSGIRGGTATLGKFISPLLPVGLVASLALVGFGWGWSWCARRDVLVLGSFGWRCWVWVGISGEGWWWWWLRMCNHCDCAVTLDERVGARS